MRRSIGLVLLCGWVLSGSFAEAASKKAPERTVERDPAGQGKPAEIYYKNGIPFVKPKGPKYSDRVDFARLEQELPIPKDALAKLTPADLDGWDQESLDQLYARLPAGPIPNGVLKGTVLIAGDGTFSNLSKMLIASKRLADPENVEKFAQSIWKGKHFYRDQRMLRNLLNKTAIRLVRSSLELTEGPWYSRVGNSVGDLIGPTHATVTQLDGEEYYEYFPAKLYCGQSLLDSRRESVILDYAYGDDLPMADPDFEKLGTREGLAIRDEIRMIRPGFYLGRAYVQRAFVLNFTVQNEEAAKADPGKETCWPGNQAR